MRASFLAAIVAAASCFASTASAKPPPWREGEPVPDGYHAERSSMDAALATGTALTVPTAMLPLLVLTAGPRAIPMVFPGIGPLISIGTLGAGLYGGLTLGLFGATQAAGVALFAWGFARPSVRLARDRVEAPYPAPSGSHWEHYDPVPAILSGATLLGVSYGFSALLAAPWVNESASSAVMFIPVVGPVVEMGIVGASARSASGVTPLLMLLLGTDALLQGTGFAMILGGALHRSNYIVKDRVQESVHLTPIGPAGSPGLSLVGTW